MSFKGAAFSDILRDVRATFNTGKTKPIGWRLAQLKALAAMLETNKERFCEALRMDLGKDELDAMTDEVGYVINEANWFSENLKSLMADQSADLTILNIGGTAFTRYEPLGVVLNMTAWNYPLQIALSPLAAIIAAGNCCVIKPSEISAHTSELLEQMIPRYMDKECIRVVAGNKEVATELLKLNWDHIIYTGSAPVGRIVYTAAAENLTPCTLELGGKCPTYIHKDCNMEAVCNRVCWTKFKNAGQTCLANDYILCHSSVIDEFLEGMTKAITTQYGDNPMSGPDYSRIVNDNHYRRVCDLLDSSPDKRITCGGQRDPSIPSVNPTVLTGISFTDKIMREEIFGPLLPVIPVEDHMEAAEIINNGEKPLHLYVFSNDRQVVDYFVDHTSSGGVMANDCLIFRVERDLAFGGVGASGFGVYGGKPGFRNFSHAKPVLIKTQGFEWLFKMMRYAPHNQTKANRLQLIQDGPKKVMKVIKVFFPLALLVGVGLAIYYGMRAGWLDFKRRFMTGDWLGRGEL